MRLITPIAVVGVGETRYATRLDHDRGSLALAAAQAAADDAGIDARDIDGIIAPWAGYAERHELARNLGIDGPYLALSSLSGSAGTIAAAALARLAIEAQVAKTVLCVQSIARGTGHPPRGSAAHTMSRLQASFEAPFGWHPRIVRFAGMIRRHMEIYGTTEAQLGAVAVACRAHASLCDNAILRSPLSLEDYLRGDIIADPLRAADCGIVNDGAAAFIITTLDHARDCAKRPVVVAGAAQETMPFAQSSTLRRQYLCSAAMRSGAKAFAQAGLRAHEISFAQIADSFTPLVLLQIEDLGFCAKGEGGPFVAGGRAELGGELPLNTAGGQLAQAYVRSANLVVEAVRQLRRECGVRQVAGARFGLVCGYTGAEHATMILGVDR